MNRRQRNDARKYRRARTSHANEVAAEKKHGMGPPSRHDPNDLTSPHWFFAEKPQKVWLDKEQARRNGFCKALKHEAPPSELVVGDNPISNRGFAHSKRCPVAALQKIFGRDRRRLSWALELPMKYLAGVVSGTESTHLLRAAAFDKYGLDIDSLPASFNWRAQRTSWLERSQPKEEDGEA